MNAEELHETQFEDGSVAVANDERFSQWWKSFLSARDRPDQDAAEPLTVVDLFSGAGGFGLGATIAAGLFDRDADIRCIVDADALGMEVYAHSLPVRSAVNESLAAMVDYHVRRRRGEIRFAYPPVVLDKTLAAARGIDLLLAGPPCQGHSNLNNHTRRNDPRNDLYVTTAATAVALAARGVVIENVATVVRSHGDVVEIARELLLQSGYGVADGRLKLSDLGGPQTRERYFMIAVGGVSSENLQKRFDRWVEAHRREALPVTWAIDDLEEIANQTLDTNFNSSPQPKKETRRRIDWLFDNEAHDLALAERPDCHKEGTTYTAVYGRMHEKKPAPTITTGIGTPGQGRFIHPRARRLITPHEAARIQTFPDWWKFETESRRPPRTALAKWIGDAVPPMLGIHPITVALSTILNEKPKLPWND